MNNTIMAFNFSLNTLFNTVTIKPVLNISTYDCSYNFSQFEDINCTQLIIDLDNISCTIDNDLIENTNCTIDRESDENSDCIGCYIFLGVLCCPVLCILYNMCNKKISECCKSISNCFDKKCIKPITNFGNYFISFIRRILRYCKCILPHQCIKDYDLETGLVTTNFSFDIANCQLFFSEDKSNEGKSCSICLDELLIINDDCKNKQKNIINLKCDHRFHLDCVNPWINHQIEGSYDPSCPLCRNQINIFREVKKVYYSSDNSYSDNSDYD